MATSTGVPAAKGAAPSASLDRGISSYVEALIDSSDSSTSLSARSLASQLLSLCRCSACKQTVREPVTLPCGHTSCLACILQCVHGKAKTARALPSTLLLPPRFPLASTTVPCPTSGCARSAIGRGVGSWHGFHAMYGQDVDQQQFDDTETDTGSSAAEQATPLDGFVIPTNLNSVSLGVVPAQPRASYSNKYLISKYSAEGRSVAEEHALLRTDVTLSKAIEALQRFAGPEHTEQPSSSRSSPYLDDSDESDLDVYHSFRGTSHRRPRRRPATSAAEDRSHRSEIDRRFLAVMGASEEGIDSCTVGGVSVFADGDRNVQQRQNRTTGGAFDYHEDATDMSDCTDCDDDDEEIGGAFARTSDAVEAEAEAALHSEKRRRRHTLQQSARKTASAIASIETETGAQLSSAMGLAYLHDPHIDEQDESSEGAKAAVDALHSEMMDILECQLCYMPLYEPLTTPCGHTFCRGCFARTLDHASTCPLCRADMPAFSFFQEHPCNEMILKILTAKVISKTSTTQESATDQQENLWGLAKLYEERKIAIEREERESLLSTPIFVLTLGFPHMPTILHIFEPRYRLMIRRCLESGHPRFGMVLHSQDMSGTTPGMLPYGTMLEIKTVKMLPDGRSMIETVGSHRFKILEKGSLDGYTVGRIVSIDDVPPHAEAELEQASIGSFELWESDVQSDGENDHSPERKAATTSLATGSNGDQMESIRIQGDEGTSGQSSSSSVTPYLTLLEAREAQTVFRSALGLDSLQRRENERGGNDARGPSQTVNASASFVRRSTAELVESCHAFIEILRSGSAPWLITRLNDTYGPMPDSSDVAAFGYWMALVMPIDEHEKAKLLPIRSARLRLCIVVQWIEQLRQMWWFNNGCSIQ